MGLIGDYFQGRNASSAAKSAALIGANSADNARSVEDQFHGEAWNNLSPFVGAGQNAAYKLNWAMDNGGLAPAYPGGPFSFSGVNLQNDPAYNFDLQQGQQAIQRSAAAQGGLVSGGALKDLNDYSQGFASNQFQQSYQNALAAYQQAYNQWANRDANNFNRFAQMAGMGLQGDAQMNAVTMNTANQDANLVMDKGNALAAGKVGSANAWNSAINNGNNQMTDMAMLFGA